MRKQYHLVSVGNNKFDAWDVDNLIELTSDLPIVNIKTEEIKEVNENYWYQNILAVPTLKSIVKLAQASDLKYPIILSKNGRVMDGMHRVLQAILQGKNTIPAIRLEADPKPDFQGITEPELPY